MPSFIKSLHDQAEQIRGKNLAAVMVVVIALFLGLGILIGNITVRKLKSNETSPAETNLNVDIPRKQEIEGTVVFVDPRLYPDQDISYTLKDDDGNTISLLKAEDEKLSVVEGFKVILFGEYEEPYNGDQVFMVDKILIKGN